MLKIYGRGLQAGGLVRVAVGEVWGAVGGVRGGQRGVGNGWG